MTIHDYEAGMEIMDDPTDPKELVDRKLMNKLALALTHAQEISEPDPHSDDKRERLKNSLNDPDVANFLDRMRKANRCPFQQWGVGS